jgi:bifunctional non-homologous end joining protein LigD
LVSRNGRDRTPLFAEPFRALAATGQPAMVLDGEIAVQDERGVTHIDALTEALRQRRAESFAYFAFDLLHFDGHDLRPCAIEDRKALLRDLVGAAGGPRIVAVDHITGSGQQLFEAVRQLGGEGIVSRRAGSAYRGGVGRDWLKAKVTETAAFVITGYIEREAVAVAELRDGVLVPAGLVKFGLAGRDLWSRLEPLRAGPASRGGVIPVRPDLVAGVKFFGRYHSGAIRDGVLLAVGPGA